MKEENSENASFVKIEEYCQIGGRPEVSRDMHI